MKDNILDGSVKNDPTRRAEEYWKQLVAILPSLAVVSFQCVLGESGHFESPRGYAVTRGQVGAFTVVLAHKIAQLAETQTDAILRHEIGHVLDFSVPVEALNRLAAGRGFELPSTPERRADALAELIWGDPIFYGPDFIQTLAGGIRPRPVELGL